VAIQEACDGRGILLRKLDALDHKVHCKVTMRSVSTWSALNNLQALDLTRSSAD